MRCQECNRLFLHIRNSFPKNNILKNFINFKFISPFYLFFFFINLLVF